MEKNLYIDASHPNETRIVLKSGNSIEEHEFEDREWYKKGKMSFAEKDWSAEIENFRLNNDSAKTALIEFAENLFK